MSSQRKLVNLFKSPWLELTVMCTAVLLSYIALLLISRGAEVPPEGMTLTNITWFLLGFFLLSFAIAIIAVLAGIGGGVIYTPLMLAFTPVNSLIVRATGLIVAMFSGLVSTGPFMKTGVGNLKLGIICTLCYGLGGFAGAQGAIWFAKQMGVSGEGIIRIVLGAIVFMLCLYFLRGGRKREWPEVGKVDRFSKWLNLPNPYYERSIGKSVNYKINRVGWGLAAMIGIGLISGFFGMGGGWAIVPSLNLIMGVPLKVAAASSSVIIGMGDCITVWPYIMAGAMIPLFVAPWLVGQVLGGMVGAQVLIRAGSRVIRYILIGIMFFTSFGLTLNGLSTLGFIDHVPGAVYIAVLLVVLAMTILAILDRLPRIATGGKD